MAGIVVLPDSPEYESIRRPAIPRFADTRPAAIIRCTTAADVVEALAYARRAKQPVVVRSGGHSFAGTSSTDGVVIDLSPMAGVALSRGRAVIGAGTRLGDVYDALAARGRTIPAGCGPTVGISGLTLGGGLGILGRTYGLTCDSLRAATVVLADGRTVECSDVDNSDLLWALKGGGAPGVVTTLVFDTVPAPDSTAFHLTFPPARAAEILDRWQRTSPDTADAVAASCLLSASGDLDRAPVVVVFGAVVGDAAYGDRVVDGFAEGAATDVRRHGTHRETKRWLTMVDNHGGPEPEDAHMYARSEFFRRDLPPETVTALVERLTAARLPGQSRELDFSPWGGAYNRVPADATAFPHRAERFLLKQSVTAPAGEPVDPWLDESFALTRPYGSGGVYANFPEPGLADVAYHGANTTRLRKIRSAYDPDGVFAVT
jgi:FAD/FMN-containing dehydrogenase